MPYKFKPVTDDTDPLNVSISIAGGSGTGKTYSACLLARGLAGGKPFAYVDTENRRAVHYRCDFPDMHHLDFSPEVDGEMVGFPPERWIEVLDAAEAAGYPVVILDSFSHAWEGIGGVLEQHAKIVERMASAAQERGRQNVNADNFNMLAWADIKPRYRRLIDRIVRAKCDPIICMRAKPVIQKWDRDRRQMVNSTSTKLRRDDIPWDIAADRDLVFEMTVSILMAPERPGVPVWLIKCPDQFKHLLSTSEPVSTRVGEEMRAWSHGSAQNNKEAYDAARAQARAGLDAFMAYWKTLDEAQRLEIQPIMAELKGLTDEADAQSVMNDDPFAGDAPEPIRPSEEQMREAEAAAMASAEGARAGHLAA